MNSSLANFGELSMNSKEIAELVESRHDKVKQSIERLVNKGVISQPPMGDGEKAANGVVEQIYIFSGEQGKRDSIVVVAQLSPEFTARLVDRWQELEASHAQPRPLIAHERAEIILKAELGIAGLLNVPKHIAEVEAVKAVEGETGLDYRRLLPFSPAQSGFAQEAMMLEPEDLAKHFGMKNGAELNRWLESMNLQTKQGKDWEPTEAGKPHCVRHQWSTQWKTGYNLKWSVEFVRSLLPPGFGQTTNDAGASNV
jgi:phage regulator Rha-like protein